MCKFQEAHQIEIMKGLTGNLFQADGVAGGKTPVLTRLKTTETTIDKHDLTALLKLMQQTHTRRTGIHQIHWQGPVLQYFSQLLDSMQTGSFITKKPVA